jgi:hypothetical protein
VSQETQGWLLSEDCDDQYAVSYEVMAEKGEYQTRTAVFWNKREGNSLIKEQTVWF